MSNLTSSTLMSVYPEILNKDELFNALGRTAAEQIGEAFLAVGQGTIYTRVADLDEPLLDIMAQDFNIIWYDYNFDLATKRRVIAAAFSVYQTIGTKGAMERAICAIWPESKVIEWFDYSGDPYCFKVELDIAEGSVDVSVIQKTIDLYKNVRSHLDEIVYRADEDQITVSTGAQICAWAVTLDCAMY